MSSRAKKSDNKSKEKDNEQPELTMDVETYKSSRDQAIQSLSLVLSITKNLLESQVRFANKALEPFGESVDVEAILARSGEVPTSNSEIPQREASPKAHGSDAKQRKKRVHDVNAPKRPLTPFFLFMQTARTVIGTEMGTDVKPKAVSDEGASRWAGMTPKEKKVWYDYYRENRRLYNARVHAYKQGGNSNARDMTDEEALEYAQAHNIVADNPDAQIANDIEAAAVHTVDDDEDAEGEPEKEPTPAPAITPKAKGGRKSKPAKETPAPATSTSTIVPPKIAAANAAAAAAEKGSEKKRKRGAAAKNVDDDVEELAVETPKTNPKPKKRKGKANA